MLSNISVSDNSKNQYNNYQTDSRSYKRCVNKKKLPVFRTDKKNVIQLKEMYKLLQSSH